MDDKGLKRLMSSKNLYFLKKNCKINELIRPVCTRSPGSNSDIVSICPFSRETVAVDGKHRAANAISNKSCRKNTLVLYAQKRIRKFRLVDFSGFYCAMTKLDQ